MKRREFHAFEALRPQIDLVAGLAVDDNRGKGDFPVAVRRHEHGRQRHGVLRADFGLAQIHGHRQLDRAVPLDDTSLTDSDRGQVTGFVLGMQHHGATCQYQQ